MPSTVQAPELKADTALTPGAQRTPTPRRSTRQAVPDALADVSLVDAKQIAAAACISLTSWYDLVQAGEAPAPAIRGHRCTRWRLVDVREWLVQYANRPAKPAAEVGSDSHGHTASQRRRKPRATDLHKAAQVGA